MKSKVIVIVPCWNVEKYIERCLDSILCQTYGDIEVRVTEDCSTDNTRDILKSYARADSRVILYPKREKMYQIGNIAWMIEDTNPEDIIFNCDGDDYYLNRHVISNVMKWYESDPNLWMTTGSLIDESVLLAHKDNSKLYSAIYDKPFNLPFLNRPFDFDNIQDPDSQYGAQLRTFKSHLFKRLDHKDFINPRTNWYYETSGDINHIPALAKLAGPQRYKWVSQYLYVCNDTNPLSDHVKDEGAHKRQLEIAAEVLLNVIKYQEVPHE